MEFLAYKNPDNWEICKKCGGAAIKLFLTTACDRCDSTKEIRTVWCSIPISWANDIKHLPRLEFIQKHIPREDIVSFSLESEEIGKFQGPNYCLYPGLINRNFNFKLAKETSEAIFGAKSLIGQADIYTGTVAYDILHGEEIIKKYSMAIGSQDSILVFLK